MSTSESELGPARLGKGKEKEGTVSEAYGAHIMTGNENENEHGHGHGHETTLAPELYPEGAAQHQLQSGEGEEEAERGMMDVSQSS